MSLKAVIWAQDHAPVDGGTDAAVLVALARSADEHGRGAWPSVDTIVWRTRFKERAVKYSLARMRKTGVIRPGDQSLVDHLRPDDRPVVWDLDMTMRRPDRPPKDRRHRERSGSRGAQDAPRDQDGDVHEMHPADADGVHDVHERGASAADAGCTTRTQEVLGEERESLSPSDPVTALVRRAAVVPAGDDETTFIAWMKNKYPDRGIGWWRTIAANGDLATHAADWKHEHDTAPPPRKPLPDWCGHCGIPDGMPETAYRTNKNFRFVHTDDGRVAKCHCHPEHPSRKDQP